MLSVSVVICAYTEDRWEDTLAAVESVKAQSPRPDEVIVVIDNNHELRCRLADRLPDVRVVPNTRSQGLSGARNTGAALSTGDIIVFLDDDARAEPGWLAALLGHYRDPAVLGVGGRADPIWATNRPRWWPEEFDWVVGCTYAGMESGVVRNLIGSNASFRRRLFDDHRFVPGLGRTSLDRRPLGCEETEFCIRAKRANPWGHFVYDDSAAVTHRVPLAREGFGYFRARCFAEGISKALIARTVGAGEGLASERRYVASTLPGGVLKGIRCATRGDWSGLLRAAAIIVGTAITAAGYLRGFISGRRALSIASE